LSVEEHEQFQPERQAFRWDQPWQYWASVVIGLLEDELGPDEYPVRSLACGCGTAAPAGGPEMFEVLLDLDVQSGTPGRPVSRAQQSVIDGAALWP
jgi:hypothetical protein